MMFRKITLAIATIAALSPAVSGATAVEKASMNACAKAFAASITAPGSVAPDYKLASQGRMSSGATLNFFPVEYSFDLEARDAKTGLATARAHCATDQHGFVTVLESLPVHVARPLTAISQD